MNFGVFKQVTKKEKDNFLKTYGYDKIKTVLKFSPDIFIYVDMNPFSKYFILGYEKIYLSDDCKVLKPREYYILDSGEN